MMCNLKGAIQQWFLWSFRRSI